ncbi:MAG: hypothetical protein U9N14_00995 [Pseudomonadota bacterium]|nr:hypothetical protein [Pseudomonadota bacterium]
MMKFISIWLKVSTTLVVAMTLMIGLAMMSINTAHGSGQGNENLKGAAAAFAQFNDGSAFEGLSNDMAELDELKTIMEMNGMAPGDMSDTELRDELKAMGIVTPGGEGDKSLLVTAKSLIGSVKKLISAAMGVLPGNKNETQMVAFIDQLDKMEQNIDEELAG